jgi:polyisoprenoid-binding protein YceI
MEGLRQPVAERLCVATRWKAKCRRADHWKEQNMRLSLCLAAAGVLAASSAQAAPQTYKLVKDHVNVTFSINHIGFSNTHGWFREPDGTLVLDADKPEASKVDITVNTASIDTNQAQRDKDLSGGQWLDVAKFPTMHFVSTKVTRTGQDTADVTGDLTLHGVTKPLVLKTKLNKLGPSPFGGTPTVGFSATGSLKRSDYGIATFLPNIGDEVQIVIDAEFNQPK